MITTSFPYNIPPAEYAQHSADSSSEKQSWWIARKISEVSAYLRRNAKYGELSLFTPIVTSGVQGTISIVQTVDALMQAMPNERRDVDSAHINIDAAKIELMGQFRVISNILTMPLAIASIIEESLNIRDETRKKRPNEVVDAGLRMLLTFSALGDNVASMTNGLSMAGITPAIAWATPLAIVSACFSTVIVVINWRAMKQSEKLLAMLEKTGKRDSLEALKALEEELLDSTNRDGELFANKQFGIINYEKYSAQIVQIIRKGTDRSKAALLGELQDRVKQKIDLHKLAILSAVIGFIGVMILFFPVIGPVVLGVGLIACAALISLIRYVEEKQSIKRLENVIDRLCKFDRIPHDDLPLFAQDLVSIQKKRIRFHLPHFHLR
jgi:hypothetical protein